MSKVLVIALRGLPLGLVGCYGNDWVETPTLDRLAAEGVVLDQHFAERPDPSGAVTSWRTGCYRLPTPNAASAEARSADLLALLSEAGVPTILVNDDSQPCPDEFLAGWREVRRVPVVANEGTTLERSLEAAVEVVE